MLLGLLIRCLPFTSEVDGVTSICLVSRLNSASVTWLFGATLLRAKGQSELVDARLSLFLVGC